MWIGTNPMNLQCHWWTHSLSAISSEDRPADVNSIVVSFSQVKWEAFPLFSCSFFISQCSWRFSAPVLQSLCLFCSHLQTEFCCSVPLSQMDSLLFFNIFTFTLELLPSLNLFQCPLSAPSTRKDIKKIYIFFIYVQQYWCTLELWLLYCGSRTLLECAPAVNQPIL